MGVVEIRSTAWRLTVSTTNTLFAFLQATKSRPSLIAEIAG
jgi:hypothetical protein